MTGEVSFRFAVAAKRECCTADAADHRLREDESFYIIPPSAVGPSVPGPSRPSTATATATASNAAAASAQPAPTPKTPEELSLENTSLRASLDAISKHAASVETTNRRLLETLKEWERMRREMSAGLRREVSFNLALWQ